VLAALCLLTAPARADVQRFAVIIGNNQGQGPDVTLRYAEADADKVARVLRDLGGFRPADMVVLRGESASEVTSTLISVNDRIRAAQSLPNTEVLLFVYYSGHADGKALRLGASRLEFRQLAELVRGSPARFRLLVVDACRSGTLTRVKGGSITAAFQLPATKLQGEGLAFLTASAENEDAQESDELKGSFFTHALVSGLLGAADKDGDGQVALSEAYAHAYAATLRATSRTFAGTQHPTFQYEVKGHGGLVLTRPAAAKKDRAQLVFPAGITFMVIAGDENGTVAGEVGARDPSHTLSLKPGRYFVRGRAADHRLEGSVTVKAGEVRQVQESELDRVAYAKLVRKGEESRTLAQAVDLGVSVRSQLPNASTSCVGAYLGYRIDFESFGLGSRLVACTSNLDNSTLHADVHEYSLSLSADHTWDFGGLSVALGAGAGVTLSTQSFETEGKAPDRASWAPVGLLHAGLGYGFAGRFFAALDARVETHLMQVQRSTYETAELEAATAARGGLGFGGQF